MSGVAICSFQIVGTFRCLPSKRQNFTSGAFKTVLIANNVIVLSKENAPFFSARDVNKIKRFSRNPRFVRVECSFPIAALLPCQSYSCFLFLFLFAFRTCSRCWLTPSLPPSMVIRTSRRPFYACSLVGWRKFWTMALD